jgi:hypothetical protein
MLQGRLRRVYTHKNSLFARDVKRPGWTVIAGHVDNWLPTVLSGPGWCRKTRERASCRNVDRVCKRAAEA